MQGCASREGPERVGDRAGAGSGTGPPSTCAMSKTSLLSCQGGAPGAATACAAVPGDLCPWSPHDGSQQTQSSSHSVPAQHIPTRGSKGSWWDHAGSSHLCGALSPGPLTCTAAAPHSWAEPSPSCQLCQRGLHGGDSPSVLHPHPPHGLVLCQLQLWGCPTWIQPETRRRQILHSPKG